MAERCIRCGCELVPHKNIAFDHCSGSPSMPHPDYLVSNKLGTEKPKLAKVEEKPKAP